MPKSITLDHDDCHAEYVAANEDGRQFFLTTPFIAASTPGCEQGRKLLALYLFDRSGARLSASIDDFGL